MGTYLFGIGLAENIGIFYAMQGIVSLFMPALIGIVADRWIQAQRLLGICHLLAATFMAATGYYALTGAEVEFSTLFTLYSLSVAFYMPTLGLSNSVAYSGLSGANLCHPRSRPEDERQAEDDLHADDDAQFCLRAFAQAHRRSG